MKKTIILSFVFFSITIFGGLTEIKYALSASYNEAVNHIKREKHYNFTLSVYGNANGDDTIDEEDIVYVRGILDGVNKSTRFADADFNGKIDSKDIIQIQKIIQTLPVSITLIDNRGVTVTADTPVKKPAVLFFGAMRPLLHVQGYDNNIVGIGSRINTSFFNWPALRAYPHLAELPKIGSTTDPSMETLLLLAPDVILGTMHTGFETSEIVSRNTGIPYIYADLVGNSFSKNNGAYETWRLLSLLLGEDERKRAEALIHYCDAQFQEIRRRISVLNEADKVKVLLLSSHFGEEMFKVGTCYEPMGIAGGINVAGELAEKSDWAGGLDVSPEQIILWNPDVIMFCSISKNTSTSTDMFLKNKHLQMVNAIKNKRIYGVKAWAASWDPATALCECFYMAKLFYPTLFSDLDVEAKGNEILEKFYKAPHLYDGMLESCKDYYRWDK